MYIDKAFLANKPTQAKFLLHCLHSRGGQCLHMNADKTEYMSFNQERTISTQNGGPLKFVDRFAYLGSSVSSTESDVSMRLVDCNR